VARVVYDLLFFFIVIIIVLNLIFGVIIDTFADLRSEKQQKELILKNTCFICGEYNVVISSVGSLLPLKFGTLRSQIFNCAQYMRAVLKVFVLNVSRTGCVALM